MELDLRKLEQIAAVARMGSVSGAARSLNISQPALSRTIAMVEQRFKIRLFERGRTGAKLTDVGASIVAEAERILRASRNLESDMHGYGRGDRGVARFGMGPLVASLSLADISRQALTERPRLQLRCTIEPAEKLREDLLQEKIEFLICTAGQIAPDRRLSDEAIGTIRYGLFVRRSHPLAGADLVTEAELSLFPFASATEQMKTILPGNGGGLICSNFHILRDITLSTDTVWLTSDAMAPDLMAQGALVALQCQSLPTDAQIIQLISLSGRQLSPAASLVAQATRRHYSLTPA